MGSTNRLSLSRRVQSGVALAFVLLAPAAGAQPDTLFAPEREDHSPSITLDPRGYPSIAWIATAPDTHSSGRHDELYVVDRDSTGWGTPRLVASSGDYYTPKMLFTADGARWLCWVEHDGTDSRVALRRTLGLDTRSFVLDDPTQPDLEPSLCAFGDSIIVVWQGWRDDNYEILMSVGDASGFQTPMLVSDCPLSDREPVITWGGGQAWIVWSSYRGDPYNLMLRTFNGTNLSGTVRLTDSYQAANLHPKLAWDETHQLLWVGYRWMNRTWSGIKAGEWPAAADWGSPRLLAVDGAFIRRPQGLNADGQIPLVVMEDVGYERYVYGGGTPMPDRYGSGMEVVPVPGGRVWCFYKMIGTLNELGATNRYWGVVGLNYGAGAWSNASEFFEPRTSIGWEAPVAVAQGDAVWLVWTADDRADPPEPGLNLFGHDLDLVVSRVPIDTTAAGPPQLVSDGFVRLPDVCTPEPRASFTIDDDGTSRTLLWGDNHRHSQDLSKDGISDPMFKETIFYSLDFLGYDFIAPSDHVEKFSKAIWAWVAKWATIYDVPGRFRVFPNYERTMRAGIGGDQNVLYRSVDQFDEASAALPEVDDWHVMYAAQTGVDVISVPHTTAQCWPAASNWSHLAGADPDSLPDPLRVVEVYQALRESFEYPGCPLQHPGCVVGADSGWVGLGLALGMRYGIISASDHTTKAAYMGVLAEDYSRDAIWQAIYDRHCFGTARTQKMNVEFRVAGELMGSEVEIGTPPLIFVRIEDADDSLAFIEINKNGDPSWFSASSMATDTTFSFVDPDPIIPGTSSYYYLRVVTASESAVWTSPVWVDVSTQTGIHGHASEFRDPGDIVVRAAPSPSRADVSFSLRGVGAGGAVLRVYDVTGRLVRSFDVPSATSTATIHWADETPAGSR